MNDTSIEPNNGTNKGRNMKVIVNEKPNWILVISEKGITDTFRRALESKYRGYSITVQLTK